MKKYLVITLFAFIPFIPPLYAAEEPMAIKGATSFCEKTVPEYCMQTTCPAYCNTLRGATQIAKCKTECTLENRCKLKPLAGMDDRNNLALDADNRDKLVACIAEKRDPEGTKSGRHMEKWQDLLTPSLQKILKK